MSNERVPHDGDIAHRYGFALMDNPWPDHTREYARWRDDWLFRHDHALPSASDAPGGRMRPGQIHRAEGLEKPNG